MICHYIILEIVVVVIVLSCQIDLVKNTVLKTIMEHSKSIRHFINERHLCLKDKQGIIKRIGSISNSPKFNYHNLLATKNSFDYALLGILMFKETCNMVIGLREHEHIPMKTILLNNKNGLNFTIAKLCTMESVLIFSRGHGIDPHITSTFFSNHPDILYQSDLLNKHVDRQIMKKMLSYAKCKSHHKKCSSTQKWFARHLHGIQNNGKVN